ncbi:Ethanolamine utilization protein EutN [Symmachiella macrocystis]|uniref:Ethanolamine utilization protein EutN n=1 Tax=Symmachiella macrocystis TaxID=2527985 RepID=A0A5C6BDF4_9PLAN|nr:EutN/CcmL family microcompartment protein [Symmachiella macrocystis]TWU09309.1 Ethanolamine utilization protein EutN [Symmachiella macrocystis]
MNLAQVVGTATATVKHESLAGWRLAVVQMLDAAGGPDGEPQLAIDPLGSGQGDQVILSSDGKSIRDLVGYETCPVRWAVIGLPD